MNIHMVHFTVETLHLNLQLEISKIIGATITDTCFAKVFGVFIVKYIFVLLLQEPIMSSQNLTKHLPLNL